MSDGDVRSSDLVQALGELQAEVHALRSQVEQLGPHTPPALPHEAAAGWDEEASSPDSHRWVRSLDPPVPRRASIPRWIPEIAFIVAVAAIAAVADLAPLAILATMAGSWLIVALAELAIARSAAEPESRWVPAEREQPAPADPSWFSPPVEHTLLEDVGARESDTAITRLPVAADGTSTTTQ